MKMIIANWKMNGTLEAVSEFRRAINDSPENLNELVLAFPDMFLQYASQIVDRQKASLCGQAISSEIGRIYRPNIGKNVKKHWMCLYTYRSFRRCFD